MQLLAAAGDHNVVGREIVVHATKPKINDQKDLLDVLRGCVGHGLQSLPHLAQIGAVVHDKIQTGAADESGEQNAEYDFSTAAEIGNRSE